MLARIEEMGVAQTKMLNFWGFAQTLFHFSKQLVTTLLQKFRGTWVFSYLKYVWLTAYCPKYRFLNIWVKVRSLYSKETLRIEKFQCKFWPRSRAGLKKTASNNRQKRFKVTVSCSGALIPEFWFIEPCKSNDLLMWWYIFLQWVPR